MPASTVKEERAAPANEVPAKPGRVTFRAIAVAVALSIIAALWSRQAEILVVAAQVSESVPPIPALASLILLLALNPLLKRFGPRYGLSRVDQIVIYCFVTISSAMCGPGIIRFLLMFLTSPFHYAAANNRLSTIQHLIPSWMAVSDPHAVTGFFRGSADGVPWSLWLVPLAAWGAFLIALWVAMLCMVLLARHRWMEVEQLTFPLIKLPLEMTDVGGSRTGPSFFRNPLMWLGFGAAAIYNLINILHVALPWMPAIGPSINLTPSLTAPWSSMGSLTVYCQPVLVGFGFLVPNDVSFSIWFFYLLSRVEALVGFTHGYAVAGMPFEQEQSMGAFLVMGLWFLWQLRHDLFLPGRPGRRLGLPRLPLVGLLLSFAFLTWFCVRAGMTAWVAAVYLAILLLTALASARIRADSGVALIWLFPFYQQKKLLFNLLGSAPLAAGSLPGTLTIFAILTFLSRGYFPALIGSQVDGLKMAQEVKVPRRQMAGVVVLAAAVGIALAFWIHLTTYYAHGAENVGGGLWGVDMAVGEMNNAVVVTPPDHPRAVATAIGGVVTLLLMLARQVLTHCPLHPFGYAIATSYGDFVWSSFLVVWVLKASLLRWGGVNVYRKAIPLFLGFALGHFFVAGIVWGLIGAFWPDAARAYVVSFG